MSAILSNLDLVVNRLTTITVVQNDSSLVKTTVGLNPSETSVFTQSNIRSISTTTVLANVITTIGYAGANIGQSVYIIDDDVTSITANANSFAVTGATSVFGLGLNYTYGNIVSNVSGYVNETYTIPGTYTWTCPEGVTSISMVGVGGGGGGQQKAAGGTGGAGGLIDYYNAYTVTPGTSYTIVVGGRGAPGTVAGDNGDATYFVDAAATAPAIYAAGGTGGGNMSWLTGGTSGSIINSTYSSIDTFTAQDSNGGTITYSITNGPTGLVINSSTGVLSYTQQSTPSASDGYLITINASSTSGSSIDKFYTLALTAESYLYYLLVAGGGGAGADGSVSAASPGTGGGGGVVLGSIGITSTTSGNSLVTIGSGGSLGSNGGNTSAIGTSVFGDNGVVAIGGGAGGSALGGDAGQPGGSGGGGGYSPSLASGVGGAGLQPSSIWGGYGTGGAAGSQGGLGGSAGGNNLTTYAAGSLFFTSTSALLTVPADARFNFGTGDFTIEFWAYRTISSSNQMVMNLRAGVGTTPNGCWWIDNNTSSIIRAAFVTQGGTTYSAQGANTQNWPAINTWYHFSVVRYVNDLSCYLNGVRIGGVTVLSSDAFGSSTIPLYMGKFTDSTAWTWNGGYITNARLVKGTAVYTSAFVPTVPLSNSTNTSLLLLVASDANKIIDSSTSPSTLTNNAVTYSSTIIPSASNTAGTSAAGSLLFNGTSQTLTFSAQTALSFGTGDLTIEMWVYPTSYAPDGIAAGLIDARSGTGNTTWVVGLIAVAGNMYAYMGIGNTGNPGGATIIPLNVWTHIAWTRQSSTFKIFVNGVVDYNASETRAIDAGGTSQTIGRHNEAGRYYRGYLTNIRIVKGTAVYTSAFTPTVPLTNITNTSLLLLVNSDANKIIDSSTSPVTLTNNGSITYSSTIIPSASNTAGSRASGSLVFNGSSYVSYPTNAAWAFGGGNFTVECWFYQTAYPGTNQGGSLVYLWHSGPGRSFAMYASYNGVGGIGASWNTSGGMSGGPATSLNTWYHAAFVRNGASFYLYLNGAQVATTAAVTLVTSSDPLFIGANNDASNPTWFFRGYITNVRIVKGTAVYTSAFAPTVPLAAVSGTSLLLTVDNNTNRAVDSSGNNFTPTISGATFSGTVVPSIGATVTTAGGSFYFAGGANNQRLSIPASSGFDFSGGTWTIEFWMYSTATPTVGNQCRMFMFGVNQTTTGFVVGYNNNGTITGNQPIAQPYVPTNPVYVATVTGAITLNTWYHVAMVSNAGYAKIYINGAQSGSTVALTQPTSSSPTLYIGYDTVGTVNFQFSGYLTNIRIVNGTAVYNSNFIPTVPLTNITNTKLLLLANSNSTYLLDSSTNNLTVTAGGVTYNSTIVPTTAGTSGPIAVNILGNVIARYSDGGYAANSSVNYGGGGGRVGYGVAGNAGVAYFWYAGQNRSANGNLVQSISYGGTNYWLHKFTSTNYLNMFAIGTTLTVDYLLVGGGGGAGYDVGGGGGGGGVVVGTSYSLLTGSTITVTIGQGGTSDQNAASGGADGQSSSLVFAGLGSVTAFGGGGGGSHTGTNNSPTIGHSGGSGGGGGSQYGAAGGSSTQISYPFNNGVGYGYAGGVSFTGQWGGGSGGGAGGPGVTGTGAYVAGGAPLVSTLSGSSTKYAGGGYGNSDSGAIYATGYDGSNTLQGYYGYGANGPGVPNASTYNGNPGIAIIRYLSPTPLASGGVITTYGSYTIHTFTANGTLTINSVISIPLEYLVVAGGGGGAAYGGGGGAGGFLTATGYSVNSGTPIPVVVGAGGNAGQAPSYTLPTQGLNSSFNTTMVAYGGGYGIYSGVAGHAGSGGSGGGGATNMTIVDSRGYGVYPGSLYISAPRQGYDGGDGVTSNTDYAAGGGGAGGQGAITAGGIGLSSSITGTPTYYAGGGGGGGWIGLGTGGAGGGGAGGGGGTNVPGTDGTAGIPNTGGGGGGGGKNPALGGQGGSGVVIIRYLDTYPAASSTTNLAAGYPVVSGGYRIYKWITSGTITF